jgi:hypothetical protein
MIEKRLLHFALLFIVAGAPQSGFAAQAPLAVSPGSASTVAHVEGRCPTFSWGQLEHAEQYELVIYDLEQDSAAKEPVVGRAFSGSVSSWTPSIEQCLERGRRYAWSVRALLKRGTTNWSRPNIFEVSAGPTEQEFQDALAVVRRYLVEEGTDLTEQPPSKISAPAADERPPLQEQEPSPLALITDPEFTVTSTGDVIANSYSGDPSLTLAGPTAEIIVAGKTRVSIDKFGDVTISGATIDIEAGDLNLTSTGDLTLSAGGNLNLEAAADVSIEGTNIFSKAAVKLKDEAPVTETLGTATAFLKGAQVLINP